MIAATPKPPYFAVIFSALRTEVDEGYAAMAQRMVELAMKQPGFLGIENAQGGMEITVSYWADDASITAWKAQVDHLEAQRLGRDVWYCAYAIRVAKVERAYAKSATE